MSLVDSGIEPFTSVIRHHDYYIANGDLSFLVEQVQFRVHKYFFERESSFFAARLSVPAAAGKPPQGTPSTPIIIKDVTPDQFASFLWVFYNPHYSIYEAPANVWGDILRLAHLWVFPNMKALCIRELETKEMLDVKRVKLYHDNDVDRNLLIPRYAALCARDEPLTYAEGLDLGIQVALQIAAGRERIRSFVSASGERTPLTPTVRGADLTGYIRELFNVEETGVTPPSYTSVKEKEGEATQAGGLSTATPPAMEEEPAQAAPPVLVKPPVNPTQAKKEKKEKKKEVEQPDQLQQEDSALMVPKKSKKKAAKASSTAAKEETPLPAAETKSSDLEAPPVADSAAPTEPVQLPVDESSTKETVPVPTPLEELTSEFPSLDTAEALPVTSTEPPSSEPPSSESLVDVPVPPVESSESVLPVESLVDVSVPPVVVKSPVTNPIESADPAPPAPAKTDEAAPSTQSTETDAPPAPPTKAPEPVPEPTTPSVPEKVAEPVKSAPPPVKPINTAFGGKGGRHGRNAPVVPSKPTESARSGWSSFLGGS